MTSRRINGSRSIAFSSALYCGDSSYRLESIWRMDDSLHGPAALMEPFRKTRESNRAQWEGC
jgi:hypothetical protein